MQDTISRLRAISGECILRHVAGYDWLVRVKQNTARYIKPVRLNEAGAALWRAVAEGAEEDVLLSVLADGEEPTDEAREALEDFLDQLCAALDGKNEDLK